MVAAGRLAQRLGVATRDTVERSLRLLRAFGLPVAFDGPGPDATLEAMGRDKKVRDGKLPFVLAPRIGEGLLAFDVPVDSVRETLKETQGSDPGSG